MDPFLPGLVIPGSPGLFLFLSASSDTPDLAPSLLGAYGEMTFTHRRLSRVGDGAGGKIETPVTIGTVVGRKHFYQRQSQRQLEASDAPARVVANEQFVCFDDPAVDVLQNDLLVEGSGVIWKVNHVRVYDFQRQADVEVVK